MNASFMGQSGSRGGATKPDSSLPSRRPGLRCVQPERTLVLGGGGLRAAGVPRPVSGITVTQVSVGTPPRTKLSNSLKTNRDFDLDCIHVGDGTCAQLAGFGRRGFFPLRTCHGSLQRNQTDCIGHEVYACRPMSASGKLLRAESNNWKWPIMSAVCSGQPSCTTPRCAPATGDALRTIRTQRRSRTGMCSSASIRTPSRSPTSSG